MRFAAFHLMPWPYLPEDFPQTEDSAWVTYPNSHFEPKKGHELYQRYLEELTHAANSGFEIVCVNEHHQTAYGLMPAPNLIAMNLIERHPTVKVAIIGNAIPLRDHPLRVAEEVAMLDVISGGRIYCGLVRGIGAEYFNLGTNPVHSEERFREAHDLLVKAWSEPGPINWEGKHYNFRYANPWPRPLQQPMPEIWVPTQGSKTTVYWAAERRYPVIQTAAPLANLGRTMAQYAEACESFGYTPHPHQMGWSPPVFIGDDDESAVEQFRPHLEWLYNYGRHRPAPAFFPPGYLSPASWQGVLKARGNLGREKVTIELMMERGEVVVGGPETVLKTLKGAAETYGFGTLVPMIHTGTMSHEETITNIDRFQEYILPELRDFLPDPNAALKAAEPVS